MDFSTTNNPSESIQWSDSLLLGFGPMDAIHEEFVACVAAIQRAVDAQIPVLMRRLISHARAHFDEEDGWMQATQFGAVDPQ